MKNIDVSNLENFAENDDEDDQEKTRERNDWILLWFLSQFMISSEEKKIEEVSTDKCDHHA